MVYGRIPKFVVALYVQEIKFQSISVIYAVREVQIWEVAYWQGNYLLTRVNKSATDRMKRRIQAIQKTWLYSVCLTIRSLSCTR